MKIGIIGGGITGLTAAYELGKVGHQVTVLEQADRLGGLASTFRDENWDWPLEKFYHHLFASDNVILDLSKELGLGDKIIFPRPITAIWEKGTIAAFDSPIAVLAYPHLSFIDKMRVGLVTAWLRLTENWQSLEKETAHEWLQRYVGQNAYRSLFEPLLAGKFNGYYREVNMAWWWARFHKRTPRLGYYIGSYQTFIDALAEHVGHQGGVIELNTTADVVRQTEAGISVVTGGQPREYDRVIVTVSPKNMLKLAPELPDTYLDQLRGLRSLAAIVMVLALKRSLTDKYYWINLPKTEFPFLAFVEHTNYQSSEHYGGDHIVYLGDYPAATDRHFTMSKEELLAEYIPRLTAFNPAFEPSWVRKSWLFREEYGQPIVTVNYSKEIPPIHTPWDGLYFASMSHVYPWDRGSNYAVEMGQRLATLLVHDAERA